MPIASLAFILIAATGQTIDAQGIRAGGVRIDASGVHTPGASVDASGVHAASAGRGTTILSNGGHRSVDCRGGGLTVNGNGNTLDVVNCSRVVVAGNRNDVSWRASKGTRVGATNVGTGNTVRQTAWS